VTDTKNIGANLCRLNNVYGMAARKLNEVSDYGILFIRNLMLKKGVAMGAISILCGG